MQNRREKRAAWRWVFPILAAILWIAAIACFFIGTGSYDNTDPAARQRVVEAVRWQPACTIGAILSTAAAYVLAELETDRGD